MQSFSKWKKKYTKKHVSNNLNETILWLNLHNIENIPTIVNNYDKWACIEISPNVLHLKRYKLVLQITGFEKPYVKNIVSLLTPKEAIKEEFFNMFGNICKVVYIDIRTIERRHCNHLTIIQSTIHATVKTLHREVRSSKIIANMYKNTKRNSWPCIADSSIKKYCFPKRLSLNALKEKYNWSTDNYHQKLVHYFTENIIANNKTPRLVLMFGIPGSGKNWVLDKRQKTNHVVINVDDCLAMLPDYWRGILELQEKDKYAHDWIRTFRAECAEIAAKLFKYALVHKMNIVWNGTGKNMSKYNNFIKLAKKKGYIIELNGIWVPLNIAKARVRKRRDSYGRVVPDKIITTAVLNVPNSFKKLRVEADYARIWENSPCKSPKIIWDKHQGWIHNKLATGWVSPIRRGI